MTEETMCECTQRAIDSQPVMPLLHVMMSEVVEDVRLVRRSCGHLIIDVPGDKDWTQEHYEALNKANAILGLAPVTDPTHLVADVTERLA